jgi:predicted NAD/FAD-dependent oxidoreductase
VAVALLISRITGLACGQALREAGAGVVVFEQSRSLGGRLAIPRLPGPWLADGAEAEPPRCVRTLTAFFEYDGDQSGPAAVWSGIEHGNQPDGLSRSICENHKTGRILPGRTAIVAHGTPAFREEHFDSEREPRSGLLESEVREAWELPAAPRAVFSHRWGFSVAAHPFAEIPVLPGGIHPAGDAVSRSQIGAVFASGRAAAQTLVSSNKC